MEVNNIIFNIKEYLIQKLDIISINNPIIKFTKPLINRVIENNIYKIESFLKLLSDKNGNIDINNIIDDMLESVNTTESFTIPTSFIGDINIGNGKVIFNLPFVNKSIAFNKTDLEDLKLMITKDK